jgi:hypothetical protein
MSRKSNRDDAPLVCVVISVAIAILAITLRYAWRLELVERAELQALSGRVVEVYRTNPTKGRPTLHILVDANNRRHHLLQEDLSCCVPGVLSLRDGDAVRALSQPDVLGRNLEWVWELECRGRMLFSYDDVLRFKIARGERLKPMTYGCGVVAVAAAGLGGLLRYRRGTWRGAA